ncbi:hypothetical protein ACSBR2_012009 [Camellia fascicularis]
MGDHGSLWLIFEALQMTELGNSCGPEGPTTLLLIGWLLLILDQHSLQVGSPVCHWNLLLFFPMMYLLIFSFFFKLLVQKKKKKKKKFAQFLGELINFNLQINQPITFYHLA